MRKHLILATCIAGICFCTFAASKSTPVEKYQLSTHILDVNLGTPAPGVPIILFRQDADGISWTRIAKGVTDRNGRISNFLPSDKSNSGIYKLRFETGNYFRKSTLFIHLWK